MKVSKIGIALSAGMLLYTTVTAYADERLVASKGRYVANVGNANIVIDAEDIEENAEAIARLNGQLGGLSFRYGTEKDVGKSEDNDKSYYWSKDSQGEWVKIGAVGNALTSDVMTGKKFSSESGVDIVGEMPNPTSANVSTGVNPSENLSVGASTVTVNNSTDTTEDHSLNATLVNLGIGEQLNIPYGYYNKGITVSNGVSDRSAFLNADALDYVNKQLVPKTPTENSTMAAGYYDENSLNEAMKTAFNLGMTAGSVNPQKLDVTYHIEHTHGSYCYPLANPTNYRDNSYSSDYYDSDYNSHYDVYHHRYSCQCSVCGRTFNGNGGDRQEGRGGRSSSMIAAAKAAAENAFYAHLSNGRCTAGGIQCGKTEGPQDITDVSVLGAGDNVVSATIDFTNSP